jgi:ubiquinone/menaquinone biosynthesis C-methylase UbiE
MNSTPPHFTSRIDAMDKGAPLTEIEASAGDARVRVWLEIRDPLELQLEPLGREAIKQLGLRSGERVLDVGFGIGSTPTKLAQIVGPSGKVVGIDLLSAALDVMRSEANRPPNVRFIQGDAEVYPFAPGSFDAAFSRFGVMFFTEPVAAFTNIRRALRSGGRIAFVCWRRLAENELDALPIRAALPHLPAHLVAEAEKAPHFSFADSAWLRETLTRAGYEDIHIREYDADVRSGDLQSMVSVCSRVGSLGALLREHPEFRRDAVGALENALIPYDGPGGPALRAATWVVGASAP